MSSRVWTNSLRVALVSIALCSFADVSASPPQEPTVSISLVRLISSPGRYEGKRVLVEGFAVLEFENQSLYLNQSDADYLIRGNATWLDISEALYHSAKRKQLNRHYLRVEGTFDPRETGHMGSS